MADAQLLALQARMAALQARHEALKWANVQDSHGMAYTPDHFFAVESELLKVAAAFAAHGVQMVSTARGCNPEEVGAPGECKAALDTLWQLHNKHWPAGPEHLRLTTWTIQRDADKEAVIFERIKHARAYYAEVIAEFERRRCRKSRAPMARKGPA